MIPLHSNSLKWCLSMDCWLSSKKNPLLASLLTKGLTATSSIRYSSLRRQKAKRFLTRLVHCTTNHAGRRVPSKAGFPLQSLLCGACSLALARRLVMSLWSLAMGTAWRCAMALSFRMVPVGSVLSGILLSIRLGILPSSTRSSNR
jgi:hypothetical protein